MKMMKRRLLILMLALAALPAALEARVERFALVIGNNRGLDRTRTLRYAERDAARVAGVLTELCDVGGAHLELLTAARPAQVLQAVGRISAGMAAVELESGAPSVLYVFFSGHSDGVDLEMGEERLAFAQLREALDATPADLKIVIVDSCRSGAFTGDKGGTPAPAFDVRLVDTLDANGTAVITSASAAEAAQESEPVQGSFFTHHLLSGLQGAADRNNDGRVTLSEVYEYAYHKTVTGSLLTLRGPQHPSFDFSLTGRGDVVLADLARGVAALRFTGPAQGVFWVIDDASETVLAEVDKPPDTERRLALPRGRYLVAQRRGGQVLVQAVALDRGDEVAVLPERMTARDLDLLAVKGHARPPSSLEVFAHYGLSSGSFHTLGVLHQANLGLRVDAGRFTFLPRLVYGDTSIDSGGLRYRVQQVGVESYALVRVDLQRLDLFYGLDLGGSWSRQLLVNGETRSGAGLVAGAVVGLGLPLWSRLALHVFWEVDAHLRQVNRALDASPAMKGALGAAWGF
jgi:hypothetical protein